MASGGKTSGGKTSGGKTSGGKTSGGKMNLDDFPNYIRQLVRTRNIANVEYSKNKTPEKKLEIKKLNKALQIEADFYQNHPDDAEASQNLFDFAKKVLSEYIKNRMCYRLTNDATFGVKVKGLDRALRSLLWTLELKEMYFTAKYYAENGEKGENHFYIAYYREMGPIT